MSEQASQRSRELFGQGYYCAESVLLAVAESRDIHSDVIPGIATPFCSGIARTCGMCGAVSGGIMGIGLAAGRSSPEAPVDLTYSLTREFIRRFEEQHGSTNCQGLTGCDLATEAGQKAFKEQNIIERCRNYVGDAAGMVVALTTK